MADSKNTRNVTLISHGGAGKTTLTEQFLVNSGYIEQAGTVENGNTQSDFIPEEKDHQYSINNTYFTFPWKQKKVNLIDTPGYADFRGEVVSALRMVEGAVLLIDGTTGIEVNTNYVWSMAIKNELSRFIFINKLDQEGANFSEVYRELSDKFEDTLLPVTIPCGEGEDLEGIIDILSEKLIDKEGNEQEIPDDHVDTVADYRLKLVETIVELDDELMLKYLEDEEITDKELIQGLETGVSNREIAPVFAGSALENLGVSQLMNYLVELVPDPTFEETIIGYIDGEKTEIELSPEGPFVGLVGKTMVDPYIGKLSIFRVYSGSLHKGDEIFLSRTGDKLRISKIYQLNGAEQEQVEELTTGDIGAVAKKDELETSDTITSDESGIELDKIEFPEPMLIKAASSPSEGDEEKMSSALIRYSKEDPTFIVDYNRETKETIVRGMGSIHLSVINDICQRKFEADFVTSEPKVAYKETIQRKVNEEVKYKKQSGGRGQYGHVVMRFEPLARGKDFEFEEEIFGGAIPSQYIPAVEKGVVEAKGEGVLAGYPVVDFKATVYDGSYHDVDSSEMAFKIAASKAFKQAVQKAKPVILEPIMNVKVIVPEEFMGDIMGDLNSRRGKIMGMEPDEDTQRIKAQVPQSELFSYAIELKSITGGYGNFTMEFSHYDKVPGDTEEDIIAEAKREKE